MAVQFIAQIDTTLHESALLAQKTLERGLACLSLLCCGGMIRLCEAGQLVLAQPYELLDMLDIACIEGVAELPVKLGDLFKTLFQDPPQAIVMMKRSLLGSRDASEPKSFA
jgi:hypothetical protein